MNEEREKVVRQLQERLKALEAAEALALEHLYCVRGGIAEVAYAIAQLSEAQPEPEERQESKP